MYSDKDNTNVLGCPIRRFSDQSLFSAPRNLSQSITSFFASYCQGIHQMPFSYLILLCVCEILKNHIHSYGPFASPIRLKVFLFELFVLSQHSLLEYIAILSNANTFKRPHILIFINILVHFLFTKFNNTLNFFKELLSFYTAHRVMRFWWR